MRLRSELQAFRTALDAVNTDLVGRDRELAQLRQETEELRGQHAGITRQAEAARAGLLAAIDRHEEETGRLSWELAQLAEVHEAVLSSTSWSVTRPLRCAGRGIPAAARARLASAFKLILGRRFRHY
jgi:hypothetical protein